MRKIIFDVDEDNCSITECPLKMKGNLSIKKVGGWACEYCPKFVSINRHEQTVYCNDTAEAVGTALMKARLERGITQQELADMSGLTQPGIARIESGVRNTGIANLGRVAYALGLKLDLMNSDEDEKV